jgi:TP901 family phage tail tape measure protein
MEKLADKAKEVSSNSKFNATEAGQALEYMAMAGWKTNDMLNGLNSVMELAAISGNDLAEVSDIVTDDLTALGYKSKDAEKFADVLAAIATNSNTDVEKIGQTFKNVGTVAGSLGYSIEDLGFALGTMANSAIKSGKAGTDLRSILTRLSNNTGATKNKLGALDVLTKNLGVSFYDTSGKVRPLSKVLAEARKAWKGLSDEQKISYATSIAGQRGMGAWLAMMKASPKDVNKLTKAINDSDGAADRMSKTMLDNVSGNFTKLKNNLHSGFIEAFEAMKPALNNIINMVIEFVKSIDFTSAGKALGDFATKFVSFITSLLQNLPSIINYIKILGTVLLAAFATGKIISMITGIVTAIQGLIEATGVAETVMAGFSVAAAALPIVGLIAGITALVGVFGMFSDSSDEASHHISNLTSEQKELCDAMKETAKASEEAKTKREEATAGIEGEMSYVEDLKDEYNSLIDKNGEVKKGYEDRAEAILTTMAQAMGVERSEIEKTIKKNGKLGESFDALMVKRKMNALSEAYADDYKDAIKNQKEQRENLAKLNEEYSKTQEIHQHLVDLKERLYAARKSGDQEQVDAITKEQEAYEAEHGTLQEVTGTFSDLINARNEAMTAYNNSMDVIQKQEAINEAIASGSTAKMQAVFDSVTTGIKTVGSATKEELEQQAEAVQTTAEQMMNAAGEWQSGITVQALQEQKNVLKKAKKQLGEELTDDDVRKFAIAKAKALGESIPKSVVDGLNSAKTGKDAEKIVGKYVKFDNLVKQAGQYGIAIPKSLAEGISSESTDVGAAIKTVKSYIKLGNAVNKLKDQGVTIPKKLAEGIRNGNVDVEGAVKKLNKKIKLDPKLSESQKAEAIKQVQSIASAYSKDKSTNKAVKKLQGDAKKEVTSGTKKQAEEAGKAPSKMGASIKKNKGKVSSAVKTVAKTGENAFKLDTNTMGYNTNSGVANGILDNSGLVTNAMQILAQRAEAAYNGFMKIKSPSRLMAERGMYTVLGLVNGIKANTVKAVKAMTEMTKASLGAVDKEADMHSPSKKMKKKGENLMKGLALGIISGGSTVTAVMTNSVKSILSCIPDTYKDKSKAQKELAKLRGTKVDKSIKNMSLKTLNKQIDKATSKIKSLRKELKNVWGTNITGKAKGWDAKKLQKEINKAKKELPKLRKQLAEMYGIEVNAKIKKMGTKEIKAEIKKLDALRKEIESLGIELTPELKKMDSKKLKEWLDDWKSPIKELERDLTRLSGTIIKEKFSDIITQVGEQTKGVINIAKDGVAGVIDELLKLNNFNFSEVANNATSFFSKSLSKKIDYSQRLVNYRIDQREQEYQKNIDAIEQAADAENDRLSNAKDADKQKIANDKQARLNYAKQERDEYKKNVKAAKEDEIKKIQNKRDKEVQKLEKKKKNTKDSKKKKQYSEQISALKEYYKEVIDQTKKHYDQMIKNADNEYEQKKTNIGHWYDDALEGNERYYDGLADQAKNGYDKLKDEQQGYLDSFKDASSEFMNGFNDALKEYEDAANSLINNAVSGVTSKYETLYNNLLQKQDTLTNKLRGWSDFFSVSNAKVLRVDDISKATDEIRVFYQKLEKLKGSVPEEVIDKIISSGKEEGSAYADYLLNMSDAELKQYAGQMQYYLDWADWMGQDLYHKDRDKVASDYQQAIKEAFAGIEDELAELGKNIFRGFCDGFADNIDYMDSTITTIVSQMIQQFKDELGIHSPSRVMMQIGDYTGQGFVDGLAESLGDANAEVSKMVAQIVRTVGGVSDNIGQVRIGNALSSIDGAKFGSTTNNRNVSNTENITNNYNLVQNNHSPKALTGLDTYLARRQQIAQLKLMGV